MNSCKNKDTIGLGLDSSTQLNGSLIDTATVVVNTVPEDSVATSGLTKTPLGYFNDPVLGPTQSDIAIGLSLPGGGAYTLPTGTISIDSAVLVLKYADGFYGDSLTSKYKVNVYQLGERPLSKAYYNNKVWPYNSGTLLGTRSFFAHTHDSIKIYNIITGQPDTLIKVKAQLRVPISKDFINSILFNASSAQLASNTVFQNNVKGLYIAMDKNGMTGPGGTMMFSLSDSLNVYYRTINGTTIDTAMVSLPLGTHAAKIVHNQSSAITAAFNNANSNDVIYLQGLAGTKVKIKFPYLKNLISSIGSNIVINRAELVITPTPGSTIPYKAQPKLTMYRYDIAHQPVELPDASTADPRSGGVGTFGGFYNSTLKNYHFIVTAYVQDLMDGKTIDYGTYIAPIDTTNKSTVDISPTTQTAGRTIAVGTDKNSPYRIKLNIIYTKINK
ncbi:MAG: DUF4270 family protein [Mucilaginibacter sp.]